LKDRTFVIIVTYNGMQWIDTCLKSVVNSSVKLDIIAIDNNSTDGTIEIIENEFPDVVLLKQHNNLGFGKANNLGISYALKKGCDYVFLLNQDAYLEVDTIGRMIEVHKNNLQYGVLSPIHLNGEGNKLDKTFSHYLRYDSNNYFYHDAIKQQLKSDYSVSFVNAAAWLLPVSTLKMIGGFDPIFFHYGEDDNYCQRALFHSLKIGVISNAFIRHDRENVLKGNPKSDTKKLKFFEIREKARWANINLSTNELETLIKKKFISVIKLFIKLKFSRAIYSYKEYKVLNSISKEILVSRQNNKKKAPNYLSI
jgi:GT2 family glycosyltransferase